MNINDGKFTAPVDGIYFFFSQCWSYGDKFARMEFYVNGTSESYVYRDENGGYDMLTLSSQFKLNKGDTVWVSYLGTFHNPRLATRTFFEGHLIRQINS